MNVKKIRYGIRIFTLDRIDRSISIFIWDKDDFANIMEEQNKHYGLKLISPDKEISLIMEYTNIIWDYKIYFGSYKKAFKSLIEKDERWSKIEKALIQDLKVMGLEELTEQILDNLKNKKFFAYKNKVDKQFKRYCA